MLDENKNLISDPRKIVNVFNDHFSTNGTKVQQKIPVEHGNFEDYLNKCDKNGKLYINPDGSSFFLGPTVSDKISKIIDSLDSSKSTGPNGIIVFLLKSVKDFFSIWLSKLVNLCFETGVFPDILKLAKVSPLHKNDTVNDTVNHKILCDKLNFYGLRGNVNKLLQSYT